MEHQTTLCHKNVCHNHSDLENPNAATNDRITFHLRAYSKLVSAVVLNFTKTNPLKVIKNVSLFHLNYSFGSCNMQILGGN